MREQDWSAYRWRLLEAGLGFRWVTRHVRELQDHVDDLRHEARSRGLDAESAAAVAAAALGPLEGLADNVIAHSRPCLLRRHPVWMLVGLPVLAYLLSSALMLLAGVALASLGRHAGMAAVPGLGQWAQWLVLLQLYAVLPVLVVVLVGLAVRNHSPRRYWMTGALLLCLVGSGMSMHFSLPVLDIPDSGMVAVDFSFGPLHLPMGRSDDHLWRLLANLLVATAAAGHCLRRQQAAGQQRHAGQAVAGSHIAGKRL